MDFSTTNTETCLNYKQQNKKSISNKVYKSQPWMGITYKMQMNQWFQQDETDWKLGQFGGGLGITSLPGRKIFKPFQLSNSLILNLLPRTIHMVLSCQKTDILHKCRTCYY